MQQPLEKVSFNDIKNWFVYSLCLHNDCIAKNAYFWQLIGILLLSIVATHLSWPLEKYLAIIKTMESLTSFVYTIKLLNNAILAVKWHTVACRWCNICKLTFRKGFFQWYKQPHCSLPLFTQRHCETILHAINWLNCITKQCNFGN